MTTCIRCGARASQVGIRGAVVWSRAHLGDTAEPVRENGAHAETELCPTCRAAVGESGTAGGWKRLWRRTSHAR